MGLRRRRAAPVAVLLGLVVLVAAPSDVATEAPMADPNARGLPGTRWKASDADGVPPVEWDGVALVEGPGPAAISPNDVHALARRYQEREDADIIVSRSPVLNCDSAPHQPVPVASVIKLVVAAAVLDSVDEGRLTLDEELTLRSELRSHPAGVLHQGAEGLRVTVERALNLMLAVSDNTAMDLLLERVGRQAVTATLARQEGRPLDAQQVPILSTREMFVLKFGPDPGLAERFETAGENEQIEILRSVRAEPLPAIDAGVRPSRIDTIGYFVSPAALCRAWQELACGPHWARVSTWLNRPDVTALAPSVTVVEKEGYEPGLYVTSLLGGPVSDPCGRSSASTLLHLRTRSLPGGGHDPSVTVRTLGRLIAVAGPGAVHDP